MLRAAVPFAIALAVVPASAQVPDDLVPAIEHEGLENSHVMAYLDHLTNEIGPRLTGSLNYQRACEWARDEFAALGLDVHLEPWAVWKTGWDRGQWQARVLGPNGMELQVASAAWTAGTKGAVRGPLLLIPETSVAAIRALGDSARGAYLLDTGSIPDYGAAPAGRGPGRGRGGGRGDSRADILAAAAEVGVAGLVKSSRGSRAFPNRIRVFADTRGRPWLRETHPPVPEIVVRQDEAQQLRDRVAAGTEVEVEFELRNRFRRGPIQLYNVVAELKGSQKPDECVVVCGHLDSWHQATGATDNGTGVTSTMEAARILTAVGARPVRTIRFCLWGGEEEGLLGSAEYVKRHRSEMAKVSCVLNHDTGTNWAHSLTVTEKMLPMMKVAMAPVMKLSPPDPDFEGQVFELRARQEIASGSGSDHASFGAAGVPPFDWGLVGRSNYFDYTWHSQWDTFDNAIPEYQRHTSTVVALTALGIANLPELLPREGVVRGRRGRGDATQMFAGRLGVKLKGLALEAVEAESTAAEAGLQAGDVIEAANGTPVKSVVDIFGVLRETGSFRTPIELTVRRGDARIKVTVSVFGRRNRRGGSGR